MHWLATQRSARGSECEYDGDPALRELLTRAAESPTVHRDKAHDVDEGDGDTAHRAGVHESTERALTEQADVLERLREDDGMSGQATSESL